MQNNQRFCAKCGCPLPDGSVAAKKYCTPCSVIRNIELTRERQRKEKEKRASQPTIVRMTIPRTLKEADKRYCRNCIYKGRYSEDYLCNYLLIVGKRRGCKAGDGCDKRLFEIDIPKDTRCVCERCGSKFDGKKYRRFCDDCLKEIHRIAGAHMSEKRRKNENHA